MLKKILSIFCCLVICLTLTACSTGFGSLKFTEVSYSDIPSGTIIAQNDKYTLKLDKNNMGIILVDNNTQEQWSTTPMDSGEPEVDEFGMPISKHPRVESILSVECKNFNNSEVNTYYSYTDAVKGGKLSYYTVDNGIVIRYFFSEAQVMIPLECVLTDDGVRLSVNPKMIQESENRVISISIAPFFCGVKNDTENSYLFVPSGSGALVDTKTVSDQGSTYSAQVYGYDPAIDEVADVSTNESIRLNIFGAKMGDKALCGIIDGSASSAWINVNVGSSTLGYSSIYTSFQLRGYTNHVAELFYGEKVQNVVYSKKMIDKPVSITFCPLLDDQADYNGMANVYRNYLLENYGMTENSTDVPLSIRMLGGTEMTKSFVGIPYETVYPTTTIDNAKEIIDDLNSNLDTDFAVQLKGFGDSGVDVGKIAGNLTVNKNIGSMDELKKLYDYSNSINVDLYFDFDIERYNKGSLGISKFFGSATNAGEQKATQYFYDKAVKDKNLESAYNILSPSNFKKVFNKITKKADKYAISGISFDTLSSVVYSDYTDKENSEFYSKNGFVTVAGDVIKSAKAQNKKFMASNANVYAAAMSNIVSESPVQSDKSNIFYCDVPFYQIVFKGSVPITVQSLNLASDSKLMLLKAVESGSGLGYTVISNWDNSMIDADMPYFYNSVFEDIKDDIYANVNELSSFYDKVSGVKIAKHTIHKNGLRETLFENGVCVYVNYTKNTLNTPAGKLASYEYLITE